ncbi:gfo/Idh/MocA family oxidoreductase [Stappia sp. GBMRC 2046]|uniref:Gfo/Idh/MocA family oxidoreductase n=1 Tax=Stappia sediminis TaxID=2692190 RepID=A0A7X3LRY7_9HYPH|nr:Gfo/Idh/MocA family oxidoreductase [Stappia sediminis]MXN63994.1 gfo/Idh/MocA family oxidoreductase [Stappia sediminis]
MKKIRYAVVGAGWISQQAFMPSVAQTGNSELTAIVTGNAENAAKLADFYGIENIYSYDRYDEMLDADVVDAVYIALPNSLHADYAIRAARAGKHLLVEKPLAITEAECEAMIAAAAEAGVFLMTAYRLHTDPGTIEVLEQIRNGAIGDPRLFTSVFSYQADASNHRLKAEHWGGPLQDIGVYCLNAARHVFAAEPIEAIAMQGSGEDDIRFGEVEEAIAVTLRFPGGRFAQFIASFGADTLDTYRVIGTKGEMTLEPGFRFETDTKLLMRQNEKVVFEKTSPPVDHFGGQTAYFSDCILNGVRPEPDGEEGLADVRAMLAIERAAATGEPQKIDTPPRPGHPTPDMLREIPRTDRRLVF